MTPELKMPIVPSPQPDARSPEATLWRIEWEHWIAQLPLEERLAHFQDHSLTLETAYIHSELEKSGLTAEEPVIRAAGTLLAAKTAIFDLHAIRAQRAGRETVYSQEKKAAPKKNLQQIISDWQPELTLWRQRIHSGERLVDDASLQVVREFLLSPNGTTRLHQAAMLLSELHSAGTDSLQTLLQTIQVSVRNFRNDDLSVLLPETAKNPQSNTEIVSAMIPLVQTIFSPVSDDRFGLSLVAHTVLQKMEQSPAAVYAKTNETTPYLALLHDVVYAAALTGDEEILDRAGSWATAFLKKHEKQCMAEMEPLHILSSEEMRTEYTAFLGRYHTTNPHVVFEPGKPIPLHTWFVGRYADRLMELNAAFGVITQLYTEHHPNNARKNPFQKLQEGFVQTALQQKKQSATDAVLSLTTIQPWILEWRAVQTMLHQPHQTALDPMISAFYPTDSYKTQKASQTEINGIGSNSFSPDTIRNSSLPDSVKNQLLLEYACMTIRNPSEETYSPDRIHELLTQVFGSDAWFVSERGDAFSISKNPDLGTYGIEQILFFPMNKEEYGRLHDRGWNGAVAVKIRMTTSFDSAEPVDMFLDARGQLYSGDGQPLSTIPHQQQAFLTGLFLTRLHFVTSTPQRTGEIPPPCGKQTEETQSPEDVHHRAHWRTFRRPPYTLLSPDARKHRQEILEDPKYGFDIDEMNAALWQTGVLPETNIRTFVRPSCMTTQLPPIEHSFFPEEASSPET